MNLLDFILLVIVAWSVVAGFMAGFTFKLGAIFSALLGFRLGEVGALISGSKVDGT